MYRFVTTVEEVVHASMCIMLVEFMHNTHIFGGGDFFWMTMVFLKFLVIAMSHAFILSSRMHKVIPKDQDSWVTDLYNHNEVAQTLQTNCNCEESLVYEPENTDGINSSLVHNNVLLCMTVAYSFEIK